MNGGKENTGFAIAVAWPQTYCKETGAWYEPITRWLGINRNNYYKAGHAAVVLVDSESNKCHYFDFGRYHAPYQHGRVRGAETDHDLEVQTIPQLTADGQEIENFVDILFELQNNVACHGEGKLYASYCKVNFRKAYTKAHQMQEFGPIPYGPFRYKGSNCSRFVYTAILAGEPNIKYQLKLKYLVPFTPTPKSNVNSLDNGFSLPKIREGEPFCPIKKLDKTVLVSTMPQPERHSRIPENAQWMSGEGAGSWFTFAFENTLLNVTRYSPQGVVECKGLYENMNGLKISEKHEIEITYPSHCKSVTVRVKNKEIRFDRVFI